MGQDSSCGICGEHYQECRHHRKSHLPLSSTNGENPKALCGRKNVIVEDTDWYKFDIDPDDICKDCAKRDNLFTAKYLTDEDDQYEFAYYD